VSFKKQRTGKRERSFRRYQEFAATGTILGVHRRFGVATRFIRNNEELEDIFGDPLTITIRDGEGEDVKSGSGLVEILTLFIRNLGNFYAKDGKPMPFSDSEHALPVALALRAAKNGVIELYVDDQLWLLEIVKQMGTKFLGDDAVVLRNAVDDVIPQPEPTKAEVAA
jgi:hypothetical protein